MNLEDSTVDVALIGGGVMSATLGTLLSELEPTWSIRVFEKLGGEALESSTRGTTLAPAIRRCVS